MICVLYECSAQFIHCLNENFDVLKSSQIIIIMLLGIIGTLDRGNFVFDRWPRAKEIPKIKSCSITSGQLSQKLIQYFYYFGIFRKSSVLQMSAASFSQTCIIQIFNANQKRLEVVLGIDDECVMVSRSVFITNNQNSFGQNPAISINTNLFTFQDLQQEKKDIVNSITLIWKAQDFQQADNIKNKLSFMVGVLRHMEQSEDFLSKQVIKIAQAKNNFEKKLKQKCLELNKDSSLHMEEFKVKQIFQQFYQLAQQQIRDIQIFKELQKFYYSCSLNTGYIAVSESWTSSVNNFKVPLYSNSMQKKVFDVRNQGFDEQQTNMTLDSDRKQFQAGQILLKTTLATQKKIQMLPQALKDARINRLYNSVLNINDLSLEDILWRERLLSISGALQTIEFLKQNQMGLNVYPFDLKKYYNLYALKCLPNWTLIRKFDTKIFPNQSILRQISQFSKFKRINMLTEKLKYIILHKVIKQVNVYIYLIESLQESNKVKRFQFDEEEQDQWNQNSQKAALNTPQKIRNHDKSKARKQSLLLNYVNKSCSLNQILREQPEFGKISEVLKTVIQKMEKKRQNENEIEKSINLEEKMFKKPKWGFYYVQQI